MDTRSGILRLTRGIECGRSWHPEDEQEEFKKLLVQYRNLYSFLSQVIPYQDADLERLYAFVRLLLNKLPRIRSGLRF